MGPERWRKVERLYHSALELEPSRRTAFLEEAGAGDESLIQEVHSLLAESQDGDRFLEAPVVEGAATALAANVPQAVDVRPMPAAIGPYRVIRLLGEGGMGFVYEAEQDQPRRTVALKVIKPGFAAAETLWRFQHESQALGRLQHPGIAQIYEAGTADTGFGPQPYFAMELIRGLLLREYAERHKLTARDRLALMAKVCDAVEHAHQRGVIHRDLKPGNILVDDVGQPKIVDFGVARATDSDLQHTRQTELGQLVGTLAYMSPEQVLGDPAALDTRSDVYALGVIMYEMLVGKLPYDIGGKPLPEAVAVIREAEPAPLSSLDRHFRGDIHTIVAKALEKDKSRRYGSAAELAADIRRYLRNEPVAARPPSVGYQLQKFARRHKALVTGAAAVVAVLGAGVVVSTWEAVRARRAEAVAQAVNDFLRNDLLAQASSSNQSGPSIKPDPHLEVRTVLDRAAARIEGKFVRQPEVEAAIRDTIGRTYDDLSLYPQARINLERVLELQRRTVAADNPTTLRTINHLGGVALRQGRFEEAETLFSQALRAERRVLGSQHPETLVSMSGLASAYSSQDRYAQAEVLHKQALEMQRRILGPEHRDTLATMMGLATDYDTLGDYAQAEALFSQILEIERRVFGPEHPSTLNTMDGLAFVYGEEGKYPQVVALYTQILDVRRRVLGAEHWETLKAKQNLSEYYRAEGKYAEAEALSSELVETARRIFPTPQPLFMAGLAKTYAAEGKHARAIALFGEALEFSRHQWGPDYWITVDILLDLSIIYELQAKYSLAEINAKQALEGRIRTLGNDQLPTMEAAAGLAQAYISQARFAAAEPLSRQAVEVYRKKQPDDWQRFRAESLLGASLAGQKSFGVAEVLLLEGYRGMAARKAQIAMPDRYCLDLAHQWVVRLYQAWGKPDIAEEWKKRTD